MTYYNNAKRNCRTGETPQNINKVKIIKGKAGAVKVREFILSILPVARRCQLNALFRKWLNLGWNLVENKKLECPSCGKMAIDFQYVGDPAKRSGYLNI